MSGFDNYQRILGDSDVWIAMQTTAHFVFWTILLQTLIGFGLAYLIDRKFRGHAFWTTIILVPMMLSPAVVGNFWRFLYEPQIGLFAYIVSFFSGIPATQIQMLSNVSAGAVGDHHRRHLDVDALRDADLPRRAALDPRLHLRGGGGRPRLQLAAVLVDHAADGAALHHAGDPVSRHRELQDVRHGQPADRRRAGLDHRGRLDHAEAAGLRELADRLFLGLRHHPVRRGVRPRQHLRQGAEQGEADDELRLLIRSSSRARQSKRSPARSSCSTR